MKDAAKICLALAVVSILVLAGAGCQKNDTSIDTVSVAGTVRPAPREVNAPPPPSPKPTPMVAAAPPVSFAGFDYSIGGQGSGEQVIMAPAKEEYDGVEEKGFLLTRVQPLSTFSIDVDTASYSNIRRFLNGGSMPHKDAVRIEEMVNYFHYDYAQPSGEHPLSAAIDVADCPWNSQTRLVRVGLKGREIDEAQRPPSNLVFFIDVSGSMAAPNRLRLVQRGLVMLTERLKPSDKVAIVVYAGNSGVLLESTPCTDENRRAIVKAIEGLAARGSTHGSAGIREAYRIAAENFIEKGANRVIIATDGDFNVGVTNTSALVDLVEEKAQTGVFLTVLGFGMGNLKDATLEKLADKGNGHYAYVDNLSEARKVFIQQMGATLITIAKDVKIQVEFNPGKVAAYRLIGYENRLLAAEDFNDDTKDAGEVGAGHQVTALYEIVPPGADIKLPEVDSLKYQQAEAKTADSEELLTLKVRYKAPDGDESTLMSQAVKDGGRSLGEADDDFRFAVAVAGFGMLLRQSKHCGELAYDEVLELAQGSQGEDRWGHRAQMVRLVRDAKTLDNRPRRQ